MHQGVIMKKSFSNLLTLVLACLGCVLALLLTVQHYRPTTLPCSVHGNGCGTTLTSAYAHVGPIPTALFGFAMYAILAALCWKRRERLTANRQQEAAWACAAAEGETNGSAAPVSLYAGVDPFKSSIRTIGLAIWTLSALAFGISWWLQYVSIWQLYSFCPYCFTSALTVTAIFVLASRDALLDGRHLTGEQKMLAGILGFVAV